MKLVTIIPQFVQSWTTIAKVVANSSFAKLASFKLSKQLTRQHEAKLDQQRIE
jgi:hypothetical protein